MTFSYQLFSQKGPSWMFDWILNTPLRSSVFRKQKKFAFVLMFKSPNQLHCQNDLSSREIQIRYYCQSPTNILIWKYNNEQIV